MPIITDKILESLRARPERDAWRLVNALRTVIDALFALEKDETDPERLRAFAAASIDASKDLEAILAVIQEKIDD